MSACPFCGAVSRNVADLAAHSRTACETRINERIAHAQAALDREIASLEALHAVKAADWSGALS